MVVSCCIAYIYIYISILVVTEWQLCLRRSGDPSPSLEDKKKEPKGEEKNWTGVSSIWEFQAASAVSRHRTFQIKLGVSHEPWVMWQTGLVKHQPVQSSWTHGSTHEWHELSATITMTWTVRHNHNCQWYQAACWHVMKWTPCRFAGKHDRSYAAGDESHERRHMKPLAICDRRRRQIDRLANWPLAGWWYRFSGLLANMFWKKPSIHSRTKAPQIDKATPGIGGSAVLSRRCIARFAREPGRLQDERGRPLDSWE